MPAQARAPSSFPGANHFTAPAPLADAKSDMVATLAKLAAMATA